MELIFLNEFYHRSPKSDSLCIWSSPLEFFCLVYALNGDLVFRYAPDAVGLGVAAVSWSPCGNLLAVAGCDGTLRFFNALNWYKLAISTLLK